MLVITKSLRGFYKNPDQIAHKVLADRIGVRDPGNKPKSNDRIPYVYIETKGEVKLQGDRIETPEFIRENTLKPDYMFYITNQIMKPVAQIYSLIVENLKGFKHKPNYYENKDSSLIYMADKLIHLTKSNESGFYLDDYSKLSKKLIELDIKNERKTILIGVPYALLDLIDFNQFQLNNTIIMETGGMKGKRKEMVRKELHEKLKLGFGVKKIHSEYGMTELLSQAYSQGDGVFKTPFWMKAFIRDINDAQNLDFNKKSGAINIIDLANYNSCSFIATDDMGKFVNDDEFEVIGRIDNSDLRGCNLLI